MKEETKLVVLLLALVVLGMIVRYAILLSGLWFNIAFVILSLIISAIVVAIIYYTYAPNDSVANHFERCL